MPRLNVYLSEDQNDRLYGLKTMTKAKSMAAVIARALAVYEFFELERAGGGQFVVEKGGDRKHVVIV